MMRVVIVDDEPLARKGLAIRLSELADIEIVAQCANGRDALEKIPALQPDLVFLDIQMPLLTGIDLVKALPNAPGVIFTTAYRNYAIESYELEVIDYLLKPITFNRFPNFFNIEINLI